jgi:outer membrane receptor protein involved in Fe transport
MIKFIISFSLFFICLINSAIAQTDSLHFVKGIIKDDVTNEPIIGATISYVSGKGTQTDLDGNYLLKLKNGSYTFTISYLGYKQQIKKVTVNNNVVLLNVALSADIVLNEVEIVADVAKIRETPVAISNISAKQIQEELGARDIPMLLNSTPGVYATQQGGGAGDARVNIRGFSQNNVGVLVDGVPVNDMESGAVFWSNWAGLSEVTKTMQVQRGLGASRLALPSAGGTMNIITSSIDEKRFFVVKKDWANNAYERFAIGYNSGIIKNKFGVTLAGSYTKGDGWVNQTSQTAWSYFAKFTYRINSKNLIVFGANGAPQSHAQKATLINMSYYDKEFAQKQGVNTDSIYSITNQSGNPYTTANIGQRGLQFNPDWGYVNGQVVNTKVNYFHKPLLNLSYFLTINDKLTYSNVLYASFGRGGGTSLSNNPGTDQAGTGQLNLQSVYNVNSVYVSSSIDPTLHAVKSTYIYSSINNHNWVGTLSTLKWQINKAFHFTGGFDARYYNGIHYQTPYNLLGADYVQQSVNRDKNLAPISKDPTPYIKKVGDVINIYYASKVTWLGLFTQLEYKKNKLSTFLTLTGNQSSMQNINYYGRKDIVLSKTNIIHNAVGYGDTLFVDNNNNVGASSNGLVITHNGDGSVSFFNSLNNKQTTIGPNYKTYSNSSSEARTNTSEVKYYYGYTIKGGANYKLTDNHNIFINTGYMNLAPRYTNVFDRSGTELKNVKNQFITALELGYGLKYSKIAVNVNGYITQWKNKPLDFASTFTDIDGNIFYYNVPGVDANLKGIELDFSYQATKWLSLNGFGMLADWRWTSTGTAYVFSDAGNLVNTIDFDAKNLHIANSPQQQIGGSVRLEPFKGFYIKPQYTFFNKMYSQFDPTKYSLNEKGTDPTDYRSLKKDTWQMPGYGLVDLFAGYTIKLEKVSVNINASINNLLNTTYVTDASYSSTLTPDKYNAINALVFMGQGRRGNIGFKITF